jgi:ABC-type uncharacterized transport system substrate-binding protein
MCYCKHGDWNSDVATQMIRAAIGLMLLALSFAQAQAHPHIWIIARSEILFDSKGQLTGFQHTWTFDPAYSAFAVMGLDSDRDGKPDTDKLAQLAEASVGSIHDFGYFTNAKVNGGKTEFEAPTVYAATFGDGRLTLRFILPLKAPVKAKTVGLQVDDPNFYVAFTMDPGPDAVTLTGSAAGCALSVKRPEKTAVEGMQVLADEIANALKGQLGENSSITKDFKASVIVACP